MHHVIVTRTSIALTLLLGALVLAFALGVHGPSRSGATGGGGPTPPASGTQLFERHCARCHAEAELVEPLRNASDRQALQAEWLRFLADHGEASPEEDLRILGHLSAQ